MGAVFTDYFEHTSVRVLYLALLVNLAAVTLLDLWHLAAWMLLVVAIAPFYEWLAHKYMLHTELAAAPAWLRQFQIDLHHHHHLDPANRQKQFAPVSALVIMFGQFYGFFALLMWDAQGALVPLLAAFIYYVFYEWVHLAHHTPSYRPRTRFGNALREAHMRHHFHNENYNWGITNMLGDVVLGTWKSVDSVPKSATARHISNYGNDQ